MTPPETCYAKSGELRIAYQVVGSGPLDIVFVPGFVSNLDLWWEEPGSAHSFSRLAAFSRLILFDPPYDIGRRYCSTHRADRSSLGYWRILGPI